MHLLFPSALGEHHRSRPGKLMMDASAKNQSQANPIQVKHQASSKPIFPRVSSLQTSWPGHTCIIRQPTTFKKVPRTGHNCASPIAGPVVCRKAQPPAKGPKWMPINHSTEFRQNTAKGCKFAFPAKLCRCLELMWRLHRLCRSPAFIHVFHQHLLGVPAANSHLVLGSSLTLPNRD